MIKDDLKNIVKKACRDLRKNQTDAEKILWKILRNRRFEGERFYRQYPFIFNYDYSLRKRFFIADFYCLKYQLVIEVDGEIHSKQKDYDNFRTFILESMDLKVVRFTNDEVLNNLPSVLKKLKKLLR